MRWVRTYKESLEATLETRRSIVIDPEHCEPFYITDCNYTPVLESMTEGTVVIEWDMALSREDRARFEEYILAGPGIVHVAPYRHYAYKPPDKDFSWLVRNTGTEGFGDLFCEEGEPDAMYFGFGLTYIPLWIAKAYLAECQKDFNTLAKTRGVGLATAMKAGRCGDVVFSQWHWMATGHRVPVYWDVRPVHLNYPAGNWVEINL